MSRICPECGASFVPASAKHGRQRFCTTAHKARFHDLMASRGKVALPLALAWRTIKRGSTAQNTYALGELSKLLDRWNAEDKAAGRNPSLIVAEKHLMGWAAADLD